MDSSGPGHSVASFGDEFLISDSPDPFVAVDSPFLPLNTSGQILRDVSSLVKSPSPSPARTPFIPKRSRFPKYLVDDEENDDVEKPDNASRTSPEKEILQVEKARSASKASTPEEDVRVEVRNQTKERWFSPFDSDDDENEEKGVTRPSSRVSSENELRDGGSMKDPLRRTEMLDIDDEVSRENPEKPKKKREKFNPRKERVERKAAKVAVEEMNRETQRLMRETGVKLPYHDPEMEDIDAYIALVKPALPTPPPSFAPARRLAAPKETLITFDSGVPSSIKKLAKLSVTDPAVLAKIQRLARPRVRVTAAKPIEMDIFDREPHHDGMLAVDPRVLDPAHFETTMSMEPENETMVDSTRVNEIVPDFQDQDLQPESVSVISPESDLSAPVFTGPVPRPPEKPRNLGEELKHIHRPGAKISALKERLQQEMLVKKKLELVRQHEEYARKENEEAEKVPKKKEKKTKAPKAALAQADVIEPSSSKSARDENGDKREVPDDGEFGSKENVDEGVEFVGVINPGSQRRNCGSPLLDESDALRRISDFEHKAKRMGALAPRAADYEGESEPDEDDIVDEDFGKDEKVAEGNEFLDDEAEDTDDEEEEDDEEELDDEIPKATKKELPAMGDDFDGDWLDGLGLPEVDSPMDNAENSAPEPVTEAVETEFDLDRQPNLLDLCSFAPDSPVLPMQSKNDETPSTPVLEFGSTQDRMELLDLLTCPPAGFDIDKPQSEVVPPPPQRLLVDDDAPLPVQQHGFRRRVMEDDEDVLPSEESSKPHKPLTTNINDSDSDTEPEEPTPGSTMKRRRVRVAPRSDDESEEDEEPEADAEELADEEAEIDEGNAEDEEPTVNEEEEYETQRARGLQMNNFLEGEAEQSDDEYFGSDDEDEAVMDIPNEADKAFVDLSHYEYSKAERNELMKLHAQKLQEEDEALREKFEQRFVQSNDDLALAGAEQLLQRRLQANRSDFMHLEYQRLTMVLDDEGAFKDDNAETEKLHRELTCARNQVDPAEMLLASDPFALHCRETAAREESLSFVEVVEMTEKVCGPPARPALKRTKSKGGLFSKRPREMTKRFSEIVAVEEKLLPVPPAVLSASSLPKKLTLSAIESGNKKFARSISTPVDQPDGPWSLRGPSSAPIVLGNTGFASKKKSLFSLLGER